MIHNFSAGPSKVPGEILAAVADEIHDYRGTGMSFMEISHRDRGGPVQTLLRETQACIRRLLDVPNDYHILFTPGGAHAQFSAVPLNLARGGKRMGAVDTGQWSRKFVKEASRLCDVYTVASGETAFPLPSTWNVPDDVSFVHVCANETISGIELLEDFSPPQGVTLVGDFTSTLMSRPVDVSKYGVLYASSGKNIGPAGYTIVIVRDDLLDMSCERTPSCLLWKSYADSVPVQNIYNTPPTYIIYISSLVLADLEENGGVARARERAESKSGVLYDVIDRSGGFYVNRVSDEYRSRMNVPFALSDRSKEADFVSRAEDLGLLQLAGHPDHGGLRATLYNSISEESVAKLAEFMVSYQKEAP